MANENEEIPSKFWGNFLKIAITIRLKADFVIYCLRSLKSPSKLWAP